MQRDRLFSICAILVFAAIFSYGIVKLMIMRFQSGDIYPPYSSYRSDPLGVRVFYESLGLLDGVEVIRNTEPIRDTEGLQGSAIFFFGIKNTGELRRMNIKTVRALEDILTSGGHIVITFVPVYADRPVMSSANAKEGGKDLKKDTDKHKNNSRQNSPHDKAYIDLFERWGLEMDLSGENVAEAQLSTPDAGLPLSLPWHGNMHFKEQGSDIWRIIYAGSGKPVIIKRFFGKGSIVASTDSYFLSNEAMKVSRNPRLLSWLCGGHKKIVFDETHLGISVQPGIVSLLRKLGLIPILASLTGFILLVLWRQTSRFIPLKRDENASVIDPGRDYTSGFTNLLRRNIPPERMLKTCLEEWKKSSRFSRQDLSPLLPGIEKIIAFEQDRPKKKQDTVKAYQAVCAIITGQRHI